MANYIDLRNELALKTQLTFIVADMLEGCIVDVKDCISRCGTEMKFEQKRTWGNAYTACRKMLADVRCNDEETQEEFGLDSDILWCFLKLIMSRSGQSYYKLYEFYQYIESFPEISPMPNLHKEAQKAFEDVYNRFKSKKN